MSRKGLSLIKIFDKFASAWYPESRDEGILVQSCKHQKTAALEILECQSNKKKKKL